MSIDLHYIILLWLLFSLWKIGCESFYTCFLNTKTFIFYTQKLVPNQNIFPNIHFLLSRFIYIVNLQSSIINWCTFPKAQFWDRYASSMDTVGSSSQAGWSVGRGLPHPIQTGPLYNGFQFSFPGVKQPGHGVDHIRPFCAKHKERVELCLYYPSGPSWLVIGWTAPYFIGIVAESRGLKSFKFNNYTFLGFVIKTVKYTYWCV